MPTSRAPAGGLDLRRLSRFPWRMYLRTGRRGSPCRRGCSSACALRTRGQPCSWLRPRTPRSRRSSCCSCSLHARYKILPSPGAPCTAESPSLRCTRPPIRPSRCRRCQATRPCRPCHSTRRCQPFRLVRARHVPRTPPFHLSRQSRSQRRDRCRPIARPAPNKRLREPHSKARSTRVPPLVPPSQGRPTSSSTRPGRQMRHSLRMRGVASQKPKFKALVDVPTSTARIVPPKCIGLSA